MNKPIEDSKVFILVSDLMSWSQTPRKIKKEIVEEGEEGEEGEEQGG